MIAVPVVTAVDEKQEEVLVPFYYTVQIGVYKNNVLEVDPVKTKKVLKFTKEDLNKYAIGQFETYKETQLFRNQLRKMGLKDAFIIAMYNGDVIAIKKALEIRGETPERKKNK